jgi:hypothetical protein
MAHCTVTVVRAQPFPRLAELVLDHTQLQRSAEICSTAILVDGAEVEVADLPSNQGS